MRRAILPAFLAIQAALGFWNLGLLSPWMDEAGTLLAEYGSADSVVRFAAGDVHPPLFYLLLWVWERLPLGLDWAVQARALTVVIGLAATVAADRLLVSRLSERARICFLALWCLSPCLLLYSRMCRSYSLQILVTVLGVGWLLRYLEKPSPRRALYIGGTIIAAIYTHYVPGLALLAAANLTLAVRRQWRDIFRMDSMVTLGILPWAVLLLRSLETWGRHTGGYAAIGGPAEIALKLGYWGMSFVAGEAVPDPVLIAAAILVPVALLGLNYRNKRNLDLALLTLILAAIGFVAVARWVSYPFIPARLLFLLPLLLVLFAGRANTVAAGALLVLAIAGDWCYFHRLGFRNKQYPMPIREIARMAAPDSVVLVDATNSDPVAMRYALGSARSVLQTTDSDAFARLDAPSAHTVWFLRNMHDVSPDALNTRFEQHLRTRFRLIGIRSYEPFTPLELRMMAALGMRDPPRYFSEVLEVQMP